MSRRLLIKSCGIRETTDLAGLAKLDLDLIGIIFVPESPRFCDTEAANRVATSAPESICIGVFRDEALLPMTQAIAAYKLRGLQLHGDESPALCADLKKAHPQTLIIKAVKGTPEGIRSASAYEGCVDIILFDTVGGGTGKSFDWSLIRGYTGKLPYMVAGGVGPENIDILLDVCSGDPLFRGIDINSAVELSPGEKDLNAIFKVIERTRRRECSTE